MVHLKFKLIKKYKQDLLSLFFTSKSNTVFFKLVTLSLLFYFTIFSSLRRKEGLVFNFFFDRLCLKKSVLEFRKNQFYLLLKKFIYFRQKYFSLLFNKKIFSEIKKDLKLKYYKKALLESKKLRYFYLIRKASSFKKLILKHSSLNKRLNSSFLSSFEQRLLTVAVRAGWYPSHIVGRQLLSHFGLIVNDQIVNDCSYLLHPGDIVFYPFEKFWWEPEFSLILSFKNNLSSLKKKRLINYDNNNNTSYNDNNNLSCIENKNKKIFSLVSSFKLELKNFYNIFIEDYLFSRILINILNNFSSLLDIGFFKKFNLQFLFSRVVMSSDKKSIIDKDNSYSNKSEQLQTNEKLLILDDNGEGHFYKNLFKNSDLFLPVIESLFSKASMLKCILKDNLYGINELTSTFYNETLSSLFLFRLKKVLYLLYLHKALVALKKNDLLANHFFSRRPKPLKIKKKVVANNFFFNFLSSNYKISNIYFYKERLFNLGLNNSSLISFKEKRLNPHSENFSYPRFSNFHSYYFLPPPSYLEVDYKLKCFIYLRNPKILKYLTLS